MANDDEAEKAAAKGLILSWVMALISALLASAAVKWPQSAWFTVGLSVLCGLGALLNAIVEGVDMIYHRISQLSE